MQSLGSNILRGSPYIFCPFPFGIIKTRNIPSGYFQSCIIMFTRIYAVEYYRAQCCFPSKLLPCLDHLFRTIFKNYPQVHAEFQAGTPGSTVKIPYRFRLVVVLTVNERYPHYILPVLQVFCNIVCYIKRPAVEPGSHRVKPVVLNPLAIEKKLIQTGNCDKSPC